MKNDNIITYSNSGRCLQQQALFLVIREKNKHILKFLKPRYVSAGIIALQEKNEGESNLCKKGRHKVAQKALKGKAGFLHKDDKGKGFYEKQKLVYQ